MDLEEIKRYAEELEKKVYAIDGFIIINVEYEYHIDLSRCNTQEKILGWVHHLTEKTWMTTDVLRRFIEIACDVNSIPLELC